MSAKRQLGECLPERRPIRWKSTATVHPTRGAFIGALAFPRSRHWCRCAGGRLPEHPARDRRSVDYRGVLFYPGHVREPVERYRSGLNQWLDQALAEVAIEQPSAEEAAAAVRTELSVLAELGL